MLERIVSGGQSGADQAGLRAARAAGIPTGGWAPLGWLAEVADVMPDGTVRWVMRPCRRLADFGLAECPEPGFPARTRANARDSDATLWFGDWHTPGGRATLDACRALGRPTMLVFGAIMKPSEVRAWVEAGNRESTAPGVGDRVEAFLRRAFGATR